MRRHLVLALVFGTALTAGVAATASHGIVTHECNLSTAAIADVCPPLSFGGTSSPTRLPGHEMAPVSVRIDASTWNGPPRSLSQVTIDFDRNGAVDAKGLPACGRSRLEGANAEAARHACRRSIVGTGTANVEIASAGQAIPIPLTLFNGGIRDGTTTLLIHGFVSLPTPRSVIATVRLRKIHEGRYGLRAVATIPPIADGAGSLLGFSLTIRRLFSYEGTKHSYAMARCLTGFLFADVVSYTLSNGESFSGRVLERPCVPQG